MCASESAPALYGGAPRRAGGQPPGLACGAVMHHKRATGIIRQRRSALAPQCASQVLTHVHTYSTGGRASECLLLLLMLMLWLLLLLLPLRCVCVLNRPAV